MPNTIRIGERHIGPGHPIYIVAEMSANHNQDYDRAVEIVRAAAEAGADAVKLQTYTPDTLTIDSDKPPFRIEGDSPWAGRTLYELYEQAYTPWEWQLDLKEHAESLGLDCFSTPFDSSAVEFLEKMDVPAYKIASFEITHLPLIAKVAEQGRPIIMSTGMATMAEIDEAVQTVRDNGNPPLALMHCNSAYPARPEEMNLRTIPHMRDTWGVPVGLSDHTLGSTSAVIAMTLGASLVEKHLTLDRSDGGPDAEFSMEPDEFEIMVSELRIGKKAIGTAHYVASDREASNKRFRQSIFAVKDIPAGAEFTHENVRVIRPAGGLQPKFMDTVLGKHAATDVERGTPLDWELVD